MPMIDDQMWWPTSHTLGGRSCNCAVWYVGDFPPPCPLHPSTGWTSPELAPITVAPVAAPRDIRLTPEAEARMVEAIARRVAELLKAG